MERTPGLARTAIIWVVTLWLVLSSAGDLVLLNVAVVTGRLVGPDGVDLFTGGAWIAGVLSAVLLLIAGFRVRRLDSVLVILLGWGSVLAAMFVGLRLASTAEGGLGTTSVGMVLRLVLALSALVLVVVLRRAGESAAQTA